MIITTKLNCKQKTIHQKHHQARKQQNALVELLPRNPINERGLNHIINICRIIYIMCKLFYYCKQLYLLCLLSNQTFLITFYATIRATLQSTAWCNHFAAP